MRKMLGLALLALSHAALAGVHQKYAPIDTNYPVPADNVLWVSPSGNDQATGTQAAPLQTVRAAYRKAQNGTTIILKSGAYREPHFFLTDNKQNITLQAEPHGDVWFKGSDIIAPERWQKEGHLWKTTGNFYNFCRVCSAHENPDFDGIATYPEQVFINDIPLRQVARKEDVTPGTFYVHDPNPSTLKVPKKNHQGFNIAPQDPLTYYLGSDPTQGITEISERPRAFTSVSKGLKIRGINFAHYSPHQRWDYNDPIHGYNAGAVSVSINADNSLIENGIFTQNTNTALFIQGKNAHIRGNRFIENGSNGFGVNRGDNALIENNYFANNNTDEHITNGSQCTAWCVTAHLKMTHAKNLDFRFNIIDDSAQAPNKRLGGYWCDEGCINAKIIGNFFSNVDVAIVYEVSESGIIASNIAENSTAGISVAGSANTRIYNNTLSRVSRPIILREDARYDGCHNAACNAKDNWSIEHKLSWDNRNIDIYNNILSSRVPAHAKDTGWPYLISIGADNLDGKRRIYSNDNFRGLDYNAYYRTSLAQEPNLITFDLPGENESIDLTFTRSQDLGKHPRVNPRINGLERHALDLYGSRAQNPYFIHEADGDHAYKQSNYHLKNDSPARGSGKALPIDILQAIDPERAFLKPGRPVDRGALANILFDATGGRGNTLLNTPPKAARQLQNRTTPQNAIAKANRDAAASQGLAVIANTHAVTQTPTQPAHTPQPGKTRTSYRLIRPYSEGLAAVEKEGRWGFIDPNGKEIIQPIYSAVQNFSDGRAAVKIDGRWGFIDKSGNYIVKPQYSDVWSYRNGRATVRDGDQLKTLDSQGRPQ